MLSFLLKAARTYLQQNKWDMAIMQLQAALTLPEFTDFPQKAVEILEELGDAYYLSGLHTQAIPVFRQSLDLSRQLGDVDLQFQQFWRLASVCRAVGNPLEAGEASSEALQLARHHQMPGKTIAALRDLSKAKLMLGEQETAVILLQEAVAITADISDKDLELDCLADLVGAAAESDVAIPDPPAPIENGVIDLGRIATDALYLAVDPYPRKPDAVFEPPVVPEDPADHPFAALKALQLDAKPPGPKKPGKP